MVSREELDACRSTIEIKIHAFKDLIGNDSRVDNLDKILRNAELLGDYCIGKANINGVQNMADMYRYCVFKHLEDWTEYIKTLPENTHKVTPEIINMSYANNFFESYIRPKMK